MNTRQRLPRLGSSFLPRTSTRTRHFVLRILLVVLLGLAVHEAATNTSSDTRVSPAPIASGTSASATPRPASDPPGAAGMLAAIDPETGLLTEPTPEQMRALHGDAHTPLQTGHVEITHLPDGTVLGKLDESYLHYSVAHIDAHGRLHADCAQGASAAAAPRPVVGNGSTPAAPEE